MKDGIYLKNNFGKVWHNFSSGSVKGFAFYEGVLLDEKMLYDRVLIHIAQKTLSSFLKELNGNFGIVIKYQGTLFLIVDKFRSYPLFYCLKNGIIVSDTGDEIMRQAGHGFNEDAVYELLALGYLNGTETVIKDIYSVEAGTYLTVGLETGTMCNTLYFSHIYPKETFSETDLFEKASLALENGFKRMLDTIKGRPVLLPLSGGYDSRLIACLCKKFGLSDVTCFTYGKPDSFEVTISKKVAETLGFKWFFVEYTDQIFEEFVNSTLNDYFLFAGNITAIPHFQDQPALMELKKQGVLTPDMVVIPGHSGDLLGGSKIPTVVLEGRKLEFNVQFASKLIYDNFYNLNRLSKRLQRVIKNKNQSAIEGFPVNTVDDLLDVYEGHWFVKAKVANFLVNSMRGYEFMGMDWRLPLWDDEYAGIWYAVSWADKYHSELYNKFMFTRYFEDYKVDFRKSVTLTTNTFSNKLKCLLPDCIMNISKKILASLKKFKVDKDINSFDRMLIRVFDRKMTDGFTEVKFSDTENVNAMAAFVYISYLKNRIY